MSRLVLVPVALAVVAWSFAALADCGGHDMQTVSNPPIVVAGTDAPMTPKPAQPSGK